MVELKNYHRRFCYIREKGMKCYPIGIREKIVAEHQSGVTQLELSKRFGISRYAIQCWIGARSQKHILPKQSGRKPAETLQEYKYENKRLQMGNELLWYFLSLTERK